MILIEGNDRTVLYSGDFRMDGNEVSMMPMLSTRDVDALYLDSTFCIPTMPHFPSQVFRCALLSSQDASIEALLGVVERYVLYTLLAQ